MNLELVDTMYGSFYGFKGDFITKRLKQLGAYERNDLAMALSFLGQGDTVLDVGGNIGTFAIPVARKVGETGKVYSFEGNPETYDVLSKNIATNHLEQGIEGIQAIVTNVVGNYVLINEDVKIGSATFYFQLAEQPSDSIGDSPKLPSLSFN